MNIKNSYGTPDNIKLIIENLRKEDDKLSRGDWLRDVKNPNWLGIIKITEEYLSVNSGDFYMLIRLCEAKTSLYGLEGLMQCTSILIDFFNNNYHLLDNSYTMSSYTSWIKNRLAMCCINNDDFTNMDHTAKLEMMDRIKLVSNPCINLKGFLDSLDYYLLMNN